MKQKIKKSAIYITAIFVLFFLFVEKKAIAQTNADLTALSISSGTILPTFATNTISYTATVASANSSITVTPTKADVNAGIEVRINGASYAAVNSGGASGSLSLNFGNNSLDVKVTAQDGITIKTYTLQVTRINTLDSVGLSQTTFPQGSYSLRLLSSTYAGPLVRINIAGNFYDVYPDSTSKSFSLTSNISAVISTYNAAVSAVTADDLSSIISGSTAASVAIWYNQSANSGRNAIQSSTGNQPVIITAGNIELMNGIPTLSFSVNKFLVITSTAFNDNLSGTVVYKASSANTSGGPSSSWYNINGIFGSEQPGGVNDFALRIYNNKFTAGNGGGTGDVSFAGNLICNNSITRVHSWTRNTSTGAVNLFVSKSVSEGSSNLNTGSRSSVPSIAIGANQTFVGGQVFFTGNISEMLLFTHIYTNPEIQTIETNQHHYYASLSANASLSSVVVNKGTLLPAFSTSSTSYFDTVMASNILITPTLEDTNASIEISIDGGLTYDPIVSGTNSDTIFLSLGTTTIRLRVTAEDGINERTYILSILRILSNDADLISLVPNCLNLSGSFTPSTTSYTCSVPNAFKAFKITPTLSNEMGVVQVRINGGAYSLVNNQTESLVLLLNVGSNTVQIRVTAEDGIAIKTYSITVTRNAAISEYLSATNSQVNFTSILTVGEAIGGYKMVGIPDGLGAFDNNNGTFTLLMNHELTNSQGITRAHGSAGAFVSKWIINKSDLTIESASDLIQNIQLWNKNTQSYDLYNATSPMLSGFSRFCSVDLPVTSALYNSSSTYGTRDKILLNGEENGAEGRAFAHVITGNNADTTVELPHLGKMSWENVVTCPSRGQKTIVAGLDDVTGGQVYFYIGSKLDTGTAIQKAGLSNGKLFGVKITGISAEVNGSIPAENTQFTLVDLGIVRDSSGAALESKSNALGVTTFLRPEDGAWDPKSPTDFYFVTTNAFNSPSRLWKLKFANIRTPETGGTISAVLDGTEGIQMMDNITIDSLGHIIIQEDVGNNAHNGKIWWYTISTDKLFQIAQHDTTRFISGGVNFLTQDEESSGVIDMGSILGKGKFLLVNQAHYSTTSELVEGGQLLAMSISNVAINPLAIVQDSIEIGTISPSTSVSLSCSSVANADYYKWTVPAGVMIVSGQGTTNVNLNFTDPIKFASSSVKPKFIYCQASNSLSNDLSSKDSVRISKTIPTFLISSILSNPNNNLGKSTWTSSTTAGSTGKAVNVVSTSGLKAGSLIRIVSGSGAIGESNTVASITSSTQFQLKNNMTVNVSSGAVLNAYVVPQNTFNTYTSAPGATNLAILVTVSSTTGLVEGMLLRIVSGTGSLREGTVVSKIIDGQNFVISQPPIFNLSNSAVLSANPILTNTCPIKVGAGISSEIDYSVVATPIRNIGYQYTLPKGARISRIGDSVIVGYDTARTTALKVVYTPASNIGVVFDSSFTSGSLWIRPYNNAGLGVARNVILKTEKPTLYKVTSTGAAIKNTTVRYRATLTNGSEAASYKWTISNLNIVPLSGSVSFNEIVTIADTLSFAFTNLFKSGSIRVSATNSCGIGSTKSFILNATTTLNKKGEEYELEEVFDQEEQVLNSLIVYPNPSQGNFTLSAVTYEKEATASVTITNNIGQVVSEFSLENNNGVIQSIINHGLSQGLYFVKVSIGSNTQIVKISVQ